MSKFREALDKLDAALYSWERLKNQLELDQTVIDQGRWVLYYAKTKGWYVD